MLPLLIGLDWLLRYYVIGCIRFLYVARPAARRAIVFSAASCKLSVIRTSAFRRNVRIAFHVGTSIRGSNGITVQPLLLISIAGQLSICTPVQYPRN